MVNIVNESDGLYIYIYKWWIVVKWWQLHGRGRLQAFIFPSGFIMTHMPSACRNLYGNAKNLISVSDLQCCNRGISTFERHCLLSHGHTLNKLPYMESINFMPLRFFAVMMVGCNILCEQSTRQWAKLNWQWIIAYSLLTQYRQIRGITLYKIFETATTSAACLFDTNHVG